MLVLLCLVTSTVMLLLTKSEEGESARDNKPSTNSTRSASPPRDAYAADIHAPSYQPIERRRQVGSKAYFVDVPAYEYGGSALGYVEARIAESHAGSGTASYEIHLRTSSCRRASAPPNQGVYDAYATMGLGLNYLESMAKELEDCTRLLARQDILAVNWLETAAGQGLVEAQLMYALSPREAIGDYERIISDPDATLEYRNRVMDYLHAALDTGSLNALEMIGDIHARGILAPHDPAQAYAYKLALQRMDGRSHREAELNELGREISARQLTWASGHAEELLKRCCY
jgi:hypothetical protein